MEKNLEEKEVYISNIECMLADLSGRVSEMEGKLCWCQEEAVEVAEVEDMKGFCGQKSLHIVWYYLQCNEQGWGLVRGSGIEWYRVNNSCIWR